MTRFARAKGSKASNERREEEATPWHVMRQQLAEQLSNLGAQNDTSTSYNLKEILSNGNSSQKEEVWSDFGEAKSNVKSLSKERAKVEKNKKPLAKGRSEKNIPTKKINLEEVTNVVKKEDSIKKGKEKHKKIQNGSEKSLHEGTTKLYGSPKKNTFVIESVDTSNVNKLKRKVEDDGETEFNLKKLKFENEKKEVTFGNIVTIKKNKKNKSLQGKNVFVETPPKPKDSGVKFINSTEKSTNSIKNNSENANALSDQKKTKKKKIPVGKFQNNIDELEKPNKTLSEPSKSSYNENKPFESEHGKFPSAKQNGSDYSSGNNNYYSNSGNYYPKKYQYGKNNYSNAPYENSFQTIIANGREIHIVKYQGFFVKKDDADELKKLRKKLKAQKIPKEKLETIMKLERRKAEKALAREKKKVCYHCRQFGHNFSDCPDIKESDMVKTGVCFKCGSLEHSHFECKVLQHQEFRHAVCFVCKEQGHIARQCPLNSQGLYPKGGSCHLCGEVTHLRKDCPKAVEEKSSKSVTVDILKETGVEDISSTSVQRKDTETKKKVIKFK